MFFFFETIAAYDLKVDKCIKKWFNELLSLRNCLVIWNKIIMEDYGSREMKSC